MAARTTFPAMAFLMAGLMAATPPAAAAPGETTDAPLPPLGDLSGIGQATAGLKPARLAEALRAAGGSRDTALRAPAFGPAVGAIGRPVALVVTPERLGTATLVRADGRFIASWSTVREEATVGLIFMPKGKGTRVREADAVAATVTATDPARDLALLTRPQAPKGVRPVTLRAGKRLPAGARLRIVGHPYGETWSLSDGRLRDTLRNHTWTSAEGTAHRAHVIRFRSTGATGNAGDPVFDIRGRMIAMDVSPADTSTLTSLAVTATEIERFLARPARAAARNSLAPAAMAEATPACSPARLSARRTAANDGTIHAIDLDCNASADASLTSPDATSAPAELAADLNRDGVPESIYRDTDRDGRFDDVRFDTNADGKPDLLGTELDKRLVPRRTRALVR